MDTVPVISRQVFYDAGACTDDEQLVRAALKTVARLGLRDAADALGVSHQKVSEWRDGKVRPLSPRVRVRLEDYLRVNPTKESPTYTEGVRYTVGRVRELLAELEATLPRSPGGDGVDPQLAAQATEAHKAAQEELARKPTGGVRRRRAGGGA